MPYLWVQISRLLYSPSTSANMIERLWLLALHLTLVSFSLRVQSVLPQFGSFQVFSTIVIENSRVKFDSHFFTYFDMKVSNFSDKSSLAVHVNIIQKLDFKLMVRRESFRVFWTYQWHFFSGNLTFPKSCKTIRRKNTWTYRKWTIAIWCVADLRCVYFRIFWRPCVRKGTLSHRVPFNPDTTTWKT